MSELLIRFDNKSLTGNTSVFGLISLIVGSY